MTPIDPNIESLRLVVFAKDQPEYIPLPSRVDGNGTVVTCWKLTWRERLRALFGTPLYGTYIVNSLAGEKRENT